MQQPSLDEKLKLASALFGSKPTTQSVGGGSASNGSYLAGEGISITDRVISAEVTQADLDEVSNSIPSTVSELENDAGFVNAEHTHDAADITSGALPLSRGGTGVALSRTANAIIRYSSNSAKFSATATNNGALYATSANGTPKFGTLPIAQGGTGATDAATALANIGAAAAEHTHEQYLTELPEHEHGQYLTEIPDDYITESKLSTELDKKANDFSLGIYNGTGGNPKPVRFASFNYSSCNSENGIAAKISLVSGHGNGSSYAFLEDAIIRVNHNGGVEVDNFKYYGADTGTYDGAARQYGDIFWVIDTTNKVVDFYVLMGQYARVYQTPWKRLTYSTGGTVTQYTSCTVYSSGTKAWANNSEIALMSDIPTVPANISAFTNDAGYAKKSEVPSVTYGTEDMTAGTSALATGAMYLVYE